jgi:hypothetical protein
LLGQQYRRPYRGIYGVFSIVNDKIHDPKFVSFLEDVARLNKQQQFVAKNYRVAGAATEIDPKKSFWEDFVTYPFPSDPRTSRIAPALPGRSATWTNTPAPIPIRRFW